MNPAQPRALMAEAGPAQQLQPMESDAMQRATPAPVDSEALLRGQRMVEISHHGEIYRLQATRLGKLILTK